MGLDIRDEALTPTALSEHAAIPIAFVVDRVLEVRLRDGGLGGPLPAGQHRLRSALPAGIAVLMGKCVSRLRNCIDAGQTHAASLETCVLLSTSRGSRIGAVRRSVPIPVSFAPSFV